MADLKVKIAASVTPLNVKISNVNRDGLSAYEVALKNGFDGTEQEWLESLAQATSISDDAIKKALGTTLEAYATKQNVADAVNGINLDAYAKKSDIVVYDDSAVQSRLRALEAKPDYDDSALQSRVAVLETKPGYDDTKLSGRVTALEKAGYLTKVPDEYVTESELAGKGYLTKHQSLDAYAKKSEVPAAYDDTAVVSRIANLEDAGYAKVVKLTQAEYDALASKDASTIYLIEG